MPVIPIPTNRDNIRKDLNDQVYKNQEQKFYAIIEEIIEVNKTGRPVLVGTTSIEKSETLSSMLKSPQGMVKLLQKRSERLIKILKEQKPVPDELIKELNKILDKPLNIKFELAKSAFEKAEQDSSLSDKLRTSIKAVFNQTSGGDADLADYIETFLRSCQVVEFIRAGIEHNILNAKQHEREAEIIAQAGRYKAVTIATNMAGRGTDILLGGNAEFLAKEKIKGLKLEVGTLEYEAALHEATEKIKPLIEEEHLKVVTAGGLHVIGTERHESRRIDNQLRGRSARQGDPGTTRFFLALDDSLMRIFGGERLTNAMDVLKAEDDLALEAGLVNAGIENAQKKVEAHNYEIRKRLLEYDDVQNTQRKVVYEERQRILEGANLKDEFINMLTEKAESIVYSHLDSEKPPELWLEKIKPDDFNEETDSEKDLQTPLGLLIDNLKADFPPLEDNLNLNENKLSEMSFVELLEMVKQAAIEAYEAKVEEFSEEHIEDIQRQILLQSIDQHWVEHLQALDKLKEGIHLRGYGQKQPLIEYKTEALGLFDQLIGSIRRHAVLWLFHTHAIKPSNKNTVSLTS